LAEPDLRQAGTEVVSSGRLAGGGFSARLPSRGRLEPAVAVDIWRDTNRRAAGRAEASIMLPLAARFSLRAGGGYKTGGYLAGFPERGGAYLQCGIGLTRGGRRGPD
jgi:hypothetical protein